MRAELEALVHELKQLRREGVDSVYLADASLEALRAAAAAYRERYPATTETEAIAVAPENRATAEDLAAEWKQTAVPAKKKAAAKRAPASSAPIPPPPEFTLPKGSAEKQLTALRERVLNDAVCQKHLRPGKQLVFGIGSVSADIFFCGEAPGAEEENQGEPFVGPAGQLLTKIIGAMGLKREQVFISNIMNWRPEMPTTFGNRPPTAEEMAYCLPYLCAQVAIIRPKVIVALGKTAVDGLLGHDPDRRMGRIRGQWLQFEETALIPTYHPSYLLRNNTNATKRMVWEDMLQVMERLEMPISTKQRGYFQG